MNLVRVSLEHSSCFPKAHPVLMERFIITTDSAGGVGYGGEHARYLGMKLLDYNMSILIPGPAGLGPKASRLVSHSSDNTVSVFSWQPLSHA